jgi:PAS domain S-box-containing protein
MLAELLEELSPQLVRRMQTKVAAAPAPRVARVPVERSGELVRQLIAALRAERVGKLSCALPIGTDSEPFLLMLGALEECVYDALDEHSVAMPAREARLLARWFGAAAEAALRDDNRRFTAMLDALPDHLILMDTDGHVLFLNEAVAEYAGKLTGRSREQLPGMSVNDLPQPDSYKQYVRSVIARAGKGETVKEEFLLLGADGGRWHEHCLAPVFAGNGKVEAIAIASRDIHARKAAEAHLQLLSKVGMLAETTEYEGVLTGVARLSIPELADWCIIDVVEDGHLRRGKVAHRDPAQAAVAEEILQLSPELSERSLARQALSGATFLDSQIDPAAIRERDPRLYEVVRQLGARSILIVPFVVFGAPIAVATFVLTSESGRRHGQDDAALALELARRAAGMIENARLQERLRRSEARFRVALAHSNIAVFEEDSEFRMRWIYNGQLGAQAAIDQTAADFLPPDVSAELATIKRRVLDTGEGARTAVDAVVRGQRRHLLLNYEPLRAIGGIVGITGTAVDITEVKRIQDELAEALAFRERLIGMLSHDLRNPLGAVLGLAQLLQLRDELSDRSREDLRFIQQAAERMNEMISTLLEFTELRFRGQPPLSIDAVELDEPVRQIVEELRVAHPGRAIEIEARGDLRGRWDRGRIAQVVSNLVANAITHGARESPVQLALTGADDSVTLVVTNRGPTIPTEHVERLFEPFWQAPVATGMSRKRGLGLGLYIVREIVLAHAGTIEVRSRDEITTFTVRLPRSTPA